jgi:hypothetical protein
MPDADVIVDALNVAYWAGSPPDLRLPLALMTDLLQRGRHVLLFFDASATYRLSEADRLVYERMRQSPEVIQVRSGEPADRAMLKYVRSAGGCIVSRDRFADHRRRFRKLIDDPARLLGGAVAHDTLHVPGLGVSAPLATSSQEAWQRALAASARISR